MWQRKGALVTIQAQNGVQRLVSVVKRDWISIVYFVIAIAVALSVSQEYQGEPSLGRYLTFILPVIFAALIRPLALLKAASSKAMVVVIFSFLSGAYFLFIGDLSATMQILLLGLGTLWFCVFQVRFIDRDLYIVYALAVVAGAIIWLLTDFNRWGLIVGTTDPAYGVWRVSFFSNIAFSAFFSLFIVLIATRESYRDAWRNPFFLVALYFTVFSFVRTAIICLVLYVLTYWILKRLKHPIELFFVSILIAISATIFVAYSSDILLYLQEITLISRLFLRSESQLSEFEIYQQLYRPWLWGEQLRLAWNSPNFLGWGSIPFVELVQNNIFEYGLEFGDTVSFPTRLLSQFGVLALLYWAFLIICLKEMASQRDVWGCAMFPIIIMAMMQWGSMFHVSDPMALLYTGVLVKGSSFVSAGVRRHGDNPLAPSRRRLGSLRY